MTQRPGRLLAASQSDRPRLKLDLKTKAVLGPVRPRPRHGLLLALACLWPQAAAAVDVESSQKKQQSSHGGRPAGRFVHARTDVIDCKQ